MDLAEFLFCMSPVMSVLHHLLYHALITFDEVTAILNTDSREAAEWFTAYVGLGNISVCFAGIVVLLVVINRIRSCGLKDFQDGNEASSLLMTLLVTAAVWMLPWKTWNDTDFVKPFTQAVIYLHGLPHYGEYSDERAERLQLVISAPLSNTPHTVIMVIGESAGRDHVKAYNDDVPFDNSPWLSSRKTDGDFIIFDNAYACQSLTQQALEHALTEKSYYNDKKFLESMNIVDIAKEKGYKTYWITNLGDDNKGSSFFHVSARSDEFINVPRKYDGDMLQELFHIDPEENNFIVFHGFGSHVVYKERYPEDKAVFPGDTVEAEYSNAIHYTDDFLK